MWYYEHGVETPPPGSTVAALVRPNGLAAVKQRD
jgi:hypothetical protein